MRLNDADFLRDLPEVPSFPYRRYDVERLHVPQDLYDYFMAASDPNREQTAQNVWAIHHDMPVQDSVPVETNTTTTPRTRYEVGDSWVHGTDSPHTSLSANAFIDRLWRMTGDYLNGREVLTTENSTPVQRLNSGMFWERQGHECEAEFMAERHVTRIVRNIEYFESCNERCEPSRDALEFYTGARDTRDGRVQHWLGCELTGEQLNRRWLDEYERVFRHWNPRIPMDEIIRECTRIADGMTGIGTHAAATDTHTVSVPPHTGAAEWTHPTHPSGRTRRLGRVTAPPTPARDYAEATRETNETIQRTQMEIMELCGHIEPRGTLDFVQKLYAMRQAARDQGYRLAAVIVPRSVLDMFGMSAVNSNLNRENMTYEGVELIFEEDL